MPYCFPSGLSTMDARNVVVSAPVVAQISEYLSTHPRYDEVPLKPCFRTFAEEHLPSLVELSLSAKRVLESTRVLLIKNFPSVDRKPELRNFIFLAFASWIGQPTLADHSTLQAIWEVAPRCRLRGRYSPTISEHNRAAALHTDSSYRELPEDFVALLAVRPASRGGASLILDGTKLLFDLLKMREGKRCDELMRSVRFPFRVPTVFTRDQKEGRQECILRPIISDKPLIRFRYDSLIEGFNCEPARATNDARWAVEYFRGALEESQAGVVKLKRADLLICSNGTVLHGRTAFRDTKRLLLRIRGNFV